MTTQHRIPLDAAVPGMLLVDDVGYGGRVLLPGGTLLTAAHIEGLRRRDVAEIAVLPPLDRSEDMERRRREERHVDRLFRRGGSDTTMQALRRTVLEFRLERRA